MAANDIVELPESRPVSITGAGASVVRTYRVENSDPEDIHSAINSTGLFSGWVQGAAHPTRTGFYVTDVKIEADPENDPSALAFCKATITYAQTETDPRENADHEIWEWGIGTTSTHITNCHKNVTGDAAYPYNNAGSSHNETLQWSYPEQRECGTGIGLDGKDVKGVDVYRPAITLKITKRYLSTLADLSYEMSMIASLVSCVNDNYCWTTVNYAPGQILFLGANIQPQKYGICTIEYNFLVGQNAEPVTVDVYEDADADPPIEATVTISPAPWDYVWFKTRDEMKTSVWGYQYRVNGIESVHVARVYRSGNFTLLGLNGP